MVNQSVCVIGNPLILSLISMGKKIIKNKYLYYKRIKDLNENIIEVVVIYE